jgi:UPF0716 protein FxsA
VSGVALLLLLFVIGPLVELYVLVQVAQAVGVLPALLFLGLVSVVGAALVKRQGLAKMARVRAALAAGQVPDDELADGFVLLAAGAMLIVPGFVTDVVGLLLLVPPVRALVRRVAGRRWASSPRRGPTRVTVTRVDVRADGGVLGPGRRRDERVIDVDDVPPG